MCSRGWHAQHAPSGEERSCGLRTEGVFVVVATVSCRCMRILCCPQVYGTANVRVADLSIIPMAVAAHTQTLAYYVGETSE